MRRSFLICFATALMIAAPPLLAASPRAQHGDPDVFSRVNRGLGQVAHDLAIALADPEVREIVHGEVARRFAGDTEALYSVLANRSLSDGTTFRQRVAAVRGQGPGGLARLDRFTAGLPNLQVAVPFHFERWDAAGEALLVTYWPIGVAEEDVRELVAFDQRGRRTLLDAAVTPDQPVVVVGLSERVNHFGYVRGLAMEYPCDETSIESCDGGGGGGGGGTGGGGSTCDTSATHAYGDPETFWQLKIFNTHEPSWKGAPEIFIQWTNPVTGVVSRREFGNVDNTDQWYPLDYTLFTWTSPSAASFRIDVKEEDGGFPGDDSDSLGNAYVAFTDSNCREYGTSNGDALFKMRYK